MPHQTDQRTSADPAGLDGRTLGGVGEPGFSAVRLRQVELILQSLDSLPTLSPVASRAMRLGSASEEGFDEIVRLIESDPALTVKILSICRRAGTGAPRSITTVKRAAVMLGWEAVQAAVLSVQIYDLLKQHPGGESREELTGFDAPGFWKHGIAVACAAELLAASSRDLRVAGEEAFVAGLVHDLGKLALDWVLPKTYDKVLRIAEVRRLPLGQAERQTIGLDHHQAGKRLGERWSLPLALQDAMWLHAQPPAALPEISHRPLLGIVAIANDIAKRLHLGWSPGGHDTRLAEQWSTALSIPAARITEVESRLHDALAERCRLLGLSDQSSQQLMIESLTQANKRLGQLGDSVRHAARAAGEHQRAVQCIGTFTAGERPGGTVTDTLTRIGEGWAQLTGRAPAAIICQTRAGDDWRVLRLDSSAQVESVEAAPALSDQQGEAMDLASIAASHAVSDSARLLRWMNQHVDRTNLPNLAHRFPARHAVHGLVSSLGPAAAVVYDPAHPLPPGAIEGTMTTFWAWALGAAAQGEGIRRMAETIAHSARELSDTREKLAEHESMARLGEFTSGAAHELNNPLTVISGRAQLLSDKLKGIKGEDDARAIVRAAESMTDLITQLHMVSRPPAVRREMVELRGWVQQAVDEARRRTGVMLPITVSCEGHAGAAIDHASAGKALVELLANALQSSPRTHTSVRVQAIEDRVIVEVADDGRGMTDHARKHAFDPFFSDMPAGRRHGLGLPLAKRLIECQGGVIELTSSPTRGTSARFEVPVAGAIEAEKRQAA